MAFLSFRDALLYLKKYGREYIHPFQYIKVERRDDAFRLAVYSKNDHRFCGLVED
jgi:hypothetical protein